MILIETAAAARDGRPSNAAIGTPACSAPRDRGDGALSRKEGWRQRPAREGFDLGERARSEALQIEEVFHVKQSCFVEALDQATRDLPTPLVPSAREKMARHWDLVKAWNARVNLTAILDDREAAYRHYRDSLEALSWLPSTATVVDFGSGAGFPGIPLAIAAPAISFTLVEPRRKRASFLEVAVARLGLENIRIRCAASTDAPDRQYDVGVTRATFSDAGDFEACLSWLAPGAPLIVFRSQPSGIGTVHVHTYRVGNVDRILEIWSAAR